MRELLNTAFRFAAGGNILFVGNVVNDLPLPITQGVDKRLFNIFLARLIAIYQLTLPGPAFVQVLPHGFIGSPRRLARFDHPGVFTLHLIGGVTTDPGKGSVDVFNMADQIGDDNGIRALIDH